MKMKTTSFLALSALALAGCAQTTPPQNGSRPAADGGQASAGADESTAGATHEAGGPAPRLAVSYDGGVLVLDAMNLKVLGEFEAEGFTRLNPAGDGRHLFVTEGDSLRLLDAGTWSEPHGNHDHSYTTDPRLTDLRVEGSHPGHVVPHAGTTALYFDGAGRIDLIDPSELDATADTIAVERSVQVEEAHHGVALTLADGSLLETVGTEEERTGARVVDAQGKEIARTDECPGVHGEAVAKGEAVVLGCEDGLVVYKDGDFSKVSSPDPYGRIGNQAGSELSSVVLGDYKVDRDADLERPERISLTDTGTGQLRLVDLGTSYSFRSLARGPQGEALVLGTDGELHVIDPGSGKVTQELPVVAEWSEPDEWQQPRPSLLVMGQFGYVSEPATKQVHVIDLDAMKVIDSAELPVVPNEVNGVDGRAPQKSADDDEHEHGHDEHGHDEEGHTH